MDDIKINVGGMNITPAPGPKKEQQPEDIKQISGKLHPEKDLDIIQEIRKIPKRDRSRTYREALRKYFFGGS
jgi:hypothetical protein